MVLRRVYWRRALSVLGCGCRLSLGVLPAVTAAASFATLVVCYAVSVLVGGNKPWLLDITHYTLDTPTSFVFRIFMIPCAVLISLTWAAAGPWLRKLAALTPTTAEKVKNTICRLVATYCGCVSGLCLVCSSAFEDGEFTSWTPHVLCASTFFLLVIVAALAATINLILLWFMGAPVNKKTLCARIIVVLILVSIGLFDALSGLFDTPSWLPPLCEWLATFGVIGFIAIFAVDWRYFFLDTALEQHFTDFIKVDNPHAMEATPPFV
eukprot:TRINITY_DN1511_c0_g1_i1.p1 TRINITY_DN1511_c0_g1~~TRINITY_DN1511_c0_g1_i1.p1  ORF type:complete len:266 (-),score=64.31 TRINITY_DN1511_c0_g1_i1:51-848(-)